MIGIDPLSESDEAVLIFILIILMVYIIVHYSNALDEMSNSIVGAIRKVIDNVGDAISIIGGRSGSMSSGRSGGRSSGRSGVAYYIHDSDIDHDFKRIAGKILETSPWKSHGIREVYSPDEAKITIRLADRKFMDDSYNKNPDKIEYYPGTNKQIRFSYTITSDTPEIYIDEVNWNGVPESGLSVDDYRIYVINHEMGHALGFDHVPCDATTAVNGVCPVMYQSTRGCGEFQCGIRPRPNDPVVYIPHMKK